MSDEQCGQFRELVSAYVDERLDGVELLRLEEHVRACAGCRAFEGDLRRFRRLLQAAEAFRPLRRPPAGFAALVASRVAGQPRAQIVPFPEVPAGRRASRVSWIGMAAAAAAAVLLFAWSGQRLLDSPGPKFAGDPGAFVVDATAKDRGSMDTLMREHAMFARGGTILGSFEERESAMLHAVQER